MSMHTLGPAAQLSVRGRIGESVQEWGLGHGHTQSAVCLIDHAPPYGRLYDYLMQLIGAPEMLRSSNTLSPLTLFGIAHQ